MSVMLWSRYTSLGDPHISFLDLIKRSYRGWLGMMASSEAPTFHPCLGPPNPKSTTVTMDPKIQFNWLPIGFTGNQTPVFSTTLITVRME